VLKPPQGALAEETADWLCDHPLRRSPWACHRAVGSKIGPTRLFHRDLLNCYRAFRPVLLGAKMSPGKPNAPAEEGGEGRGGGKGEREGVRAKSTLESTAP